MNQLPPRVIVYDGQCFLCNEWLKFLPPKDPEGRFHFCPAQTEVGRTLLEKHGIDPDNPQSFLYLEDGQPWTGSEAIIRILMGLGEPWSCVALARLVPIDFRELAYRVLSRNRYKLGGRSPTCVLPSVELRKRFIAWPEQPARTGG